MADSKKRLLELPRGATESDVKNAVMSWLLDSGIDCSSEQRTDVGPVDLHLLHRHVIIEVKKRGKLERGPGGSGGGSRGETALEQLTRYIERDSSGAEPGGLSWLGAVTDGRRWWLYKWDKKLDPLPDWQGRALSEDNIAALDRVLRRDNAGRPWPPLSGLDAVFKDVREAIRAHYDSCSGTRGTKTQMNLWLEQLRGTGNLPLPEDRERLFLDHTFLILASRLISGMRKGDRDLLSGFVGWLRGSEKAIDMAAATVATFNWTERRGDYLRGLYQDVVRADQRHAYGEYYTPDWLAQKLCSDVIDEGFLRAQVDAYKSGGDVLAVMDPACGSGTFLYHAAIMMLESEAFAGLYDDEDKPRLAARMLVGIDIHPVAVEMAIANVMRVIGSRVPRSQVQIYQGDSLLLSHQDGSGRRKARPGSRKRRNRANGDGQTTMMGETFGVETVSLQAPGNLEILLPAEFAKDGARINGFVASAKDNEPLPAASLKGLSGAARRMVSNSHENMTAIISRFGDGVWAWYIRNQAAPLTLAAKKPAGRIVANPPWVRTSSMGDESRQDAVKSLGERLGVYVGGQQATSFNLAAVFVRHCMESFAARGARTAWVLPGAAASSNKQWEKLRGFYKDAAMYDLGPHPFPQQGASAALLTGLRGGRYRLEFRGAAPRTTDAWFGHLERRMRFKEVKERQFPAEPSSWYRDGQPLARQGATIVPVPYLYVEELAIRKGRAVFTTRTSAKSKYKPPAGAPYSLPKAWVKQVVSSRGLGPFLLRTVPAVLPLDRNGRWLSGARLREKYWTDISDMYEDLHPSEPSRLADQIDWQKKLTSQFSASPPFLVHNTSGNRVYAAVARGRIMCDSGTYYLPCGSEDAALFLAALLNAPSLQGAYRHAKNSARHFHKAVWEKVPIPLFDRGDKAHRRLAALGARAEAEAAQVPAGGAGQQEMRLALQGALEQSGVLDLIDAEARRVLPGHV